MSRIKEALKKCKGNKNKHTSLSVLVVMLIIILLISTAIRSITLYSRYKIVYPEGNIDNTIIDNLITDNNENLFDMILHEGYNTAVKEDKISTNKLELDLLDNHSRFELEEVLNSKNFYNQVYDTIDNANNKYFKSSYSDNINFLIIGTEDKILYVKSGTYDDRFKYMSGSESSITWDTFYNSLNNPIMTKEVFKHLKDSSIDRMVIMRIDGKYIDNRLYTSEDLMNIYKEKGIKGLKGFGFVTLSTITEDGDILGHKDSVFMRRDENCKKLYVYHYMDIREYILNNLDKMMEQNMVNDKYINTLDKEIVNDFLFALATIVFNIISIIGLMFIYKSLEEDVE